MLALLLTGVAAPARAGDDEVDHVALAAALLRDGHVDRARRVLDGVAPDADGIDRARFYTLRGLVRHRQEDLAGARADFGAALEAGAGDPTLWVYRARCAHRLNDCAGAIADLDRAGETGRARAELVLLRADCEWRLGRHRDAFATLDDGARRFPERPEIGRTRIHRLLELGLHRAAIEAGRAFAGRPGATVDDHLFLAEALLRSRAWREAREVLEAARLRHGDDPRLLVQLAHAWLELGHPLAAARMFEAAARREPAHARDAAEVHRRAGRHLAALWWNARVPDPAEKLRQRMAIRIDQQRFEAVVALEPRLSRLGLLEADEELRYALAYAWFRLGEHGRAEAHLRKLTRPALFERAAELRQAMARCARPEARCEP